MSTSAHLVDHHKQRRSTILSSTFATYQRQLLRAALVGVLISTSISILPQSAYSEAHQPARMLIDEASDHPAEILGTATEDRRAVRHPDGRVTVESWSQPVRVEKPDGKWGWIDTTLVEKDGALQPKLSKSGLRLSVGGEGKPLASLSASGDSALHLSWTTSLPRPTVAGNRATYPNAAGPGTDLIVTALGTGFRQEIVLHQRPKKGIDLSLPIRTESSELSSTENGRLQLTDNSGRRIVESSSSIRLAGTPSNKSKSSANRAKPLKSAMVVEDGTQKLSLSPTGSVLDDPKTTYPLTISSTFLMSLDNDVDVADDSQLADPTRPFLVAGSVFGIETCPCTALWPAQCGDLASARRRPSGAAGQSTG
ncbi:hypothetical protein SAMN05421505_10458 [Sinosporangium album]|uniref:Uncharacterized protein n=1 Tax=Sinosporangium album TaxID=504805 RepID=A0A1G7U1N6_9ACTN|nr:hypothetical protein SAMN05421505_10458 [Sinosporangium album]